MSGTRSYYSNVLTTTKNEVDVALKLIFTHGSTPALYLVKNSGQGLALTPGVNLINPLVTNVTVNSIVYPCYTVTLASASTPPNANGTVAFSSTASGTNNAFTLNWPERFGAVVNLDIEVVQNAATDATYGVVATDFQAGTSTLTNPSVGTPSTTTFALGSSNGTAFSGLTTSASHVVYVYGTFQTSAS